MEWWQTTRLVEQVVYFGYDERAYTLGQLLDAMARQLLNRTVPAGAVVAREFAAFQGLADPAGEVPELHRWRRHRFEFRFGALVQAQHLEHALAGIIERQRVPLPG